jgi:hypothetical protein
MDTNHETTTVVLKDVLQEGRQKAREKVIFGQWNKPIIEISTTQAKAGLLQLAEEARPAPGKTAIAARLPGSMQKQADKQESQTEATAMSWQQEIRVHPAHHTLQPKLVQGCLCSNSNVVKDAKSSALRPLCMVACSQQHLFLSVTARLTTSGTCMQTY